MSKLKNSKSLPSGHSMPSWPNWLITIGLLGVCIGAVMPLFSSFGSTAYAYVYGAGAFISLIGRIFARAPQSSLVLRRLYRIEVWSSLFFCAAAVFMYLRTAPRDWIALTMAGGMVMLYTSIRIPREIRKASRGEGIPNSNK